MTDSPLPPGIEMTQVDPDLIGATEINSRFGFHKAAIEGPDSSSMVHGNLRMNFVEFAQWLDQVIPGGREKDVAFERLEEASMWAHKSVAYGDPIQEEADI